MEYQRSTVDHTLNSSRTHFWLQFQVVDLFRKPTGSDYFQGEQTHRSASPSRICGWICLTCDDQLTHDARYHTSSAKKHGLQCVAASAKSVPSYRWLRSRERLGVLVRTLDQYLSLCVDELLEVGEHRRCLG